MNATPTHPALAQSIRDLGIDFLVDHEIARLRTPPNMAGYPRVLVQALAEARDMPSLLGKIRVQAVVSGRFMGPQVKRAVEELFAAFSAAIAQGEAPGEAAERWIQLTGEVLLQAEGDRPFDPLILLEQQLSMGGDGLRAAMALARQGIRQVLRQEAPVLLPAPLLLREEVPARGEGTVEVIEIGDLLYGWWAGGEGPLMDALGEAQRAVRFRWIHGPTGFRPKGYFAAGFAEALREAVPDRFWEIIARIYQWQGNVGNGITRDVVEGLPVDPDRVFQRATEPSILEKVKRDHGVVTTCAIPPIRPAFVIGRKLFLGREQYPELAAEVRRLAAS